MRTILLSVCLVLGCSSPAPQNKQESAPSPAPEKSLVAVPAPISTPTVLPSSCVEAIKIRERLCHQGGKELLSVCLSLTQNLKEKWLASPPASGQFEQFCLDQKGQALAAEAEQKTLQKVSDELDKIEKDMQEQDKQFLKSVEGVFDQ
jgi:hypothetical protein